MRKKPWYIDPEDAKYDWHEKNPCNEDEPSCEECGSEDYQYYATLEEDNGEKVPYLVCNTCNHIFGASLR